MVLQREMAGAACVAQPTNNDLQQLYHDLNSAKERSDQETIRKNEAKIIELGEWLQKQGNAKELGELVKNVRPYLGSLSKAKAARLVRTLVDLFLDMDSAIGVEVDLCKECIQWAMEEKRTYLRQALEARLMALYFDTKTTRSVLASDSAFTPN
ncbi:Oidioi.mRNA.OKI2018_I69.XSR.g16497.t1.cds [Oikopleura dioica]|uniref:Oidioi.mRNA.OKI2018_I69.XSR.g16497.t1.cds n=1 Tax=Oikopleura dioica TaxID=34765 RepID=A0ABN7SQM8_OIKDI|nr:Oidioi.mRNA.OKI2018_I69.XSR.g16497.t1.cds [Oikopleura dioica]